LFGKITTKQEPGMNKQGRLEVKSSNDILDRIGGLEKVIFDSDIDSALRASSKSGSRKCLLNQKVMMWVVLAMGLFTDLPIRQVFKACRRIREKDQLPGRSALCLARQRLGSQPLVELHRMVVKRCTVDARIHGATVELLGDLGQRETTWPRLAIQLGRFSHEAEAPPP
jgi:hypothetical protein